MQTDRRLIIDFYTAEVLDRLKDYARLPQSSWRRIRVCYPQYLVRNFEKNGLGDILKRHKSNGIRWTRINEIRGEAVMLIRPGFLWDIKKYLDLKNATWIYSMWPGYFERSGSLRKLRACLESENVRYEYLHTSGHAMLSDLKKLAEAMSPDMVIPIHSFHPDQFHKHFSNVRALKDNEHLEL